MKFPSEDFVLNCFNSCLSINLAFFLEKIIIMSEPWQIPDV